MSHVFSAHPSPILAKHQDNIMASLAHRMEVARAANNLQLVELLKREEQQVIASVEQSEALQIPSLGSLTAWFNSFRQSLGKAILGESGLDVAEFVNGRDRWWYAFDSQTGKWVYADSEAELRLWIKENYRGK